MMSDQMWDLRSICWTRSLPTLQYLRIEALIIGGAIISLVILGSSYNNDTKLRLQADQRGEWRF
jgi:hypothetical protein